MVNEERITKLIAELSSLTGFISEFGTEGEYQGGDFKYACNVVDTLHWILGEISEEDFKSDAYLNITKLYLDASRIEERTGNKLSEYK